MKKIIKLLIINFHFICSVCFIQPTLAKFAAPKIIHGISHYDGCTAEGDPCECSNIQDPQCKQGLCFKGTHYGEVAIYCNCNLATLNDAEFEAFAQKFNGHYPTDAACAVKPPFGYQDAKEIRELIKKYMDLLSNNQLFQQQNVDNQQAKNALNSALKTIANELDQIYGLETQRTSKNRQLMKLYESRKSPNSSTVYEDHFKKILFSQPGMHGLSLSATAEKMLHDLCSTSKRRGNLDPCFCGKPSGQLNRKPGFCQVNKCVDPDKLRCHCD